MFWNYFNGFIANPAETSFLIINLKQIIDVPMEIVLGKNTFNSCDNPALVISLIDFESYMFPIIVIKVALLKFYSLAYRF